jgi:hypothetical protein
LKTFKLVHLDIVSPDKRKDLLLKDGLIINKEDEKNLWTIEALLPKTELDYFQELCRSEEKLTVKATISKKNNLPATFQTKVIATTEMKNYFSVLMNGYLKNTRPNIAEGILAQLLQEGLEGEALLKEFKTKVNKSYQR